MSDKLSDKDRKVFEYIKSRIDEGYAPTVREICAEFGFASTSTAHRYIERLSQAGLLEKGSNQNRAIKISGSSGTKVPLVGTVTAGMPITAIENITGYIPFQPKKRYGGKLFALSVRGRKHDKRLYIGRRYSYRGANAVCGKRRDSCSSCWRRGGLP